MSSNEYMKQYMLNRYKRVMSECINYLGGKCANCGSTADLQIDHIDRSTKSFTIAVKWNVRKSVLYAELDKCQLLCKTCHEDKTNIDMNKQKAKGNHGTVSTYRYCKCDLCKAAKSKANREYKQKR